LENDIVSKILNKAKFRLRPEDREKKRNSQAKENLLVKDGTKKKLFSDGTENT
jgi:hypothetical protein